MKKIFDFRAILIGCLADWLGTTAFWMLFSAAASVQLTSRGLPANEISKHFLNWTQSPEGFIFTLFFGLSFTFFGGYIAVKTAKHKSLFNSLVVGAVAMISGFFAGSSSPHLQMIISLLCLPPAALLGGYYYLKKWIFLPD